MFVLCVANRTKGKRPTVQTKTRQAERWATPVVIQISNLGQNKITC